MNSVTDTLRILLVEDNPGDARFLKIALEEELSERFEMIHETRLEEALQTLGEAEFDMVLLDLSLPDETGLETFRRIASVSTDTPIVVLTGLNDEETARKALQGGAQDYLVKGQFQRGSLLRAVRFSLERHKSRRNSLEHLEQWALQDSLTGLLNRRGLQKIFLEEIDSPDFDGSNFFALLVGLDNFKPLLDVFGRPAGEFILRECAQKLKASVPPGTPLGWLQGDEFLVLLPRTGADKAAALAEKMRASISGAPIPWSSETLRVSCSVGAVMVPETVSTLNELLNHAHFTLSQSKSGTKNKVSYSWGSQGEAPAKETSPLSNRFFVVSQPIYRLADNHRKGWEFFIRTDFPGFERPRDFFRLCLQTNVVSLMDYQSFRVCTASAQSVEGHLNCHFNLFPRTLVDIPLSDLLDCLSGTRPLGNFCLEISEERIGGDPSFLREPLLELKKAGVRIALEEVGFGHSSLESLLLLEPDVIKVAEGFTKGVEKSPAKMRSMERFLKMAAGWGAEVIVEGIQSLPELEALRGLGVPYGQGTAWNATA